VIPSKAGAQTRIFKTFNRLTSNTYRDGKRHNFEFSYRKVYNMPNAYRIRICIFRFDIGLKKNYFRVSSEKSIFIFNLVNYTILVST